MKTDKPKWYILANYLADTLVEKEDSCSMFKCENCEKFFPEKQEPCRQSEEGIIILEKDICPTKKEYFRLFEKKIEENQ